MTDFSKAPAPAAHAHFNPVDVTRTIFEKGQMPRTETERRHMTFNVTSYRAMLEEAGVDFDVMAERARSIGVRREKLIKLHGERKGVAKLAEQLKRDNEKKGALYQMLPADGLDQPKQIAFIVWGALYAEDSALTGGERELMLTVRDVEAMMGDADTQAYLFERASDSLMRFLTGKGIGELQAKAKADLDAEPVPGEQAMDAQFDDLPADDPDGDSGNA